ncbi:MAG TPA: hypothetical protein VFU30_14925 [Gaiellaceae bacterium]|nr:hypothetical protein [Gaiellaceae bacterium]
MKRKSNLSIITEADPTGEEHEVSWAAFSRLIEAGAVDADAAEAGTTRVVVLDAHRPLGQIVAVLLRAWSSEQEQSQQVIDALLPSSLPSAEATEQLRRNAQARAEFLEEFPALPAAELAHLAGITWANPAAWAQKLAKEEKLFAIEHGRRRLYPTFQFDSDWQPRLVIAQALHELEDAGLSGWSLALWFSAANGWLDEARPVDLLEEAPERVVAAAAEVGYFPF